MDKCSIKDCDRPIKARGLCDKHYLKTRRAGELDKFEGTGKGRYAPEISRTCPGVSKCGKKELARGFCNSCYQMRFKTGELKLLPKVNAGKYCKAQGCKNKAASMGFCATHYTRFKKYGDPLGSALKRTRKPCSTEGCERISSARGMCANCYGFFKRYGDPTKRSEWFYKRSRKKIDRHGYVLIYVGEHDNANRSSRIMEHRLVMSQFLGRPLLPNENVHHKNGNKADNRLENLELWVTSQPSGQRPTDLIEWARAILKLYEPDEQKLKELEYRNQNKQELA